MELTKYELLDINGGGFQITATFLNALARGINTILDLGRSLGTVIRRVNGGNICPV